MFSTIFMKQSFFREVYQTFIAPRLCFVELKAFLVNFLFLNVVFCLRPLFKQYNDQLIRNIHLKREIWTLSMSNSLSNSTIYKTQNVQTLWTICVTTKLDVHHLTLNQFLDRIRTMSPNRTRGVLFRARCGELPWPHTRARRAVLS